MAIKYIDGRRLRGLFIAGSEWLIKHREILNQLNVYPVPDGDTGTNMSMTFKAIEDQLKSMSNEEDVDTIARVVSEAAILGARGNSGTILSQILYGFLKSILGKEKINAKEIAEALTLARDTAYSAVNTPVEGTILTIIRRVAEEANEYVKTKDDLIGLMEVLRKVADSEVAKTQETLPKLKEAGVVDAGAKGLFYIFEGFEKFIKEGEITKNIAKKVIDREIETFFEKVSSEDIKYKYCTEFIIESDKFDMREFKDQLSTLGDSMVVAQIAGKTKAHIHTNNPGIVLEFAITLGQLISVKIDNMSVQHNNVIVESKKEIIDDHIWVNPDYDSETAVIMTADTKEIAEIFMAKGAAGVIIGGQSNNPSVGDIEKTIEKVNSDNIILLPNNKNIILAAKTAKERSKKNIRLIETKGMADGYYVLCNIGLKADELIENLNKNISIEITRSVKDTTSNSVDIKREDYLGIVNGNIEFADSSLVNLIKKVQDKYYKDNVAKITVFEGKESDVNTERLIKESYTHIKFEMYEGKQENYCYYIYIEKGDIIEGDYPIYGDVAIVVDSVSDLEAEHIKGLPIKIVPLKVRFESDIFYREGVDISKEKFWNKLVNFAGVPQTSQPSPAEFIEVYRGLFNEGYKKIVSVHASSKTSGVSQAARAAINLMERSADIEVVDSEMLSLGVGRLAIEGAIKAKEGKGFREIIDYLNERKKKYRLFFVVNTLKYLQKGGRIGKAAFLAGSLLKLKPVFTMEEGYNALYKKGLGEKHAMGIIKKYIENEAKKNKIGIMTASGAMSIKAGQLEEYIKNIDNVVFDSRLTIGAVVGSHTGPVYGVLVYPIEE